MKNALLGVSKYYRCVSKLFGMKKELYNASMRVFTMKEISARQSNAVMAMIKLQSHGVTEDQILYLNKYLERNNSSFDGTLKDRTI